MSFDETKKIVCKNCQDVVEEFTIEEITKTYRVLKWDSGLLKYIEIVSTKNVVSCLGCRKCGNVLEAE